MFLKKIIKNNLYLYGSNFKIYNPIVRKKLNEPIVILRAGHYSNETREQVKKINSNVVFI